MHAAFCPRSCCLLTWLQKAVTSNPSKAWLSESVPARAQMRHGCIWLTTALSQYLAAAGDVTLLNALDPGMCRPRLHRPWPELEAFARSFDRAAVDDVTHRHIPWGASRFNATPGAPGLPAQHQGPTNGLLHEPKAQVGGTLPFLRSPLTYNPSGLPLLWCSFCRVQQPAPSMTPAGCRRARAAVLLIQALSAWNKEHGGRLPATAAEKAEFRALLQSWQRSSGGVPMQVA